MTNPNRSARIAHGVCGVALVWSLAAPTPAGTDYSTLGPHLPAWVVVNVSPPEGDPFEAVLYYPGVTGGENGDYDGSGAPYPAISFGHGFVTPVAQYHGTLQHLASWGYLVIATRSQGNLFPSHAQYAIDLSACLTRLEALNADSGSFLFEQVDTSAFALSGHSMGGGASILAAAADARIRAVANLAAAETNPSAIAAIGSVTAPLRLIAGSEDAITPPQNHVHPMYAAAGAPRQLAMIEGGFHCGFIDSGMIFCDSGEIPRAEQLVTSRRLLTEFFELYLKQEQGAWRAVWGPKVDAEPGVSVTGDAGFALFANAFEMQGCPGETVSLDVVVENHGDDTQSFTFMIEESAWNATAEPAQTPTLGPGGSATVRVDVALPTGVGPGESGLLVCARSDSDGGTRAYLQLLASRTLLVGDLDADGAVSLADLSALLEHFGSAGGPAEGDLDGDGEVTLSDLSGLLERFGETCGR